jgi:hypothetical protein
MVTKLLLDEHRSWRSIGLALATDGYDVRSVNGESALKALSDPDLFNLATLEDRILVTGNHKDFGPLARHRTEMGASHPGLILIPGNVRGDDYGRLLQGIRALLAETSPDQWRNRIAWLPPRPMS